MDKNAFESKYKALNDKQKEAVDTIFGPLMVVAGPGTGKTTVLTLRIANILRIGNAKPDEILALTFTESGARAMREKLRELIGDTSFQVNIFTFHGFANYIRGLYPENFKKIGERMPASDADKIEIIEYILSKNSFRELRVSEFGVTISKISGRISDLKRELVDSKELKKILSENDHKERLDEFALLFEEYEDELEKRKLYDFDDAIIELINALKENPVMRSEVRERFQFILADEHQDANGSQNEILKLFKDDKEIDPPNIFVVGDDKQSIFRFQGASLEHFYNFASEFKGAKKITLEENYRSQKTILDGSHSLITNDGRDHQKLSANVKYPEKHIEVIEYGEYESELAETARRIKDLDGSVAVIARHNQTLHDLAPYLDAFGVSYRIAGERSLFDSFEYARLMSLFEALTDPYDGKLLEAIYMGYFSKPITLCLKIASSARKERKDATDIILGDDKTGIKDLIASAKKTPLIEMLKSIREEIYSNTNGEAFEVFRSVFDEARKLTIKKRSARLEDLVHHLNFLKKHQLATLSQGVIRKASVELLSVHRSKGLEYDDVFIIDTTAKKFGGSGKRGDLLEIPGIGAHSELEEERRLLYVAITRARKSVTISYSLTGSKGEECAPAELLNEIDPKYVLRKEGEEVTVDLSKNIKRLKEENIEIYREAFLERNFSVSALNNYLSCPWKYFFRNLLLIPDVPEFSSNLGTACHNVLKRFHENPKREDLKDIIEQSVMNEPFAQNEIPLALEKANEYLNAYVKDFVPFREGEVAHIEKSYSFMLNAQDFEVTVTGKIDLAREVDGVFKVIDFKTKKRMSANAIKGLTKSDTGNEWRQLQFYKLLIENSEAKSTVGSGTLTFLVPDDKGKVLSESFALTNEDKRDIESLVIKTLKSIYNFEFVGTKCEDKKCEYCKLSKIINI